MTTASTTMVAPDTVLAHHRRRTEPLPEPEQPPLRYRQDSLDVLFGRRTS
jgi:hypothetical protein